MRCIAEYVRRADDMPLLRLYIHGAPHRRQHQAVLEDYRAELLAAAKAAKIPTPIDHRIALWVLFVDPCSPDYDNLLTALMQAMDGKAHRKPTVLRSDGLIGLVDRLGVFYPNGPTKADRQQRSEVA